MEQVAHDMYQKLGNDLSRTVLVFPNKRAHLFFNEYLASESDLPIWSPVAMSISDLFQRMSPLQSGDPIRLVCELYNVFRSETQSEESLDEFYFWGELLISDFDDIDKNLVDAHRLLGNLQDLKEMDDFSFLEPEQEEAIREFFRNFSLERRTELKTRFLSLWEKLDAIYHRFKDRLTELGLSYEGMMYRGVIESWGEQELPYDRYVFVGFNVLNRVEQTFFEQLQAAGKAMFYWDYDLFYTQQIANHEAGEFLKRNLKQFGNELPQELFHNWAMPKRIRYISAATENAQARFLPQWIGKTLARGDEERESAVVLCNESLLLPVLHALPDALQNVNVTMGFPLVQTPIYSLVSAAMELQTSGYKADTGRWSYAAVVTLLKHPYVQQLSPHAERLERSLRESNRFYPLPSELQLDPFLTRLFTPCVGTKGLCAYLLEVISAVSVLYREQTQDSKHQAADSKHRQEEPDAETEDTALYSQLYRESLFQCHVKINRIYDLIESGVLVVRTETLTRLINRLLTAANIPFHGEPAIGMQVMGVLETRNLDFKHLVMLSVNEGQLPKAGGDSSFIPYNLRKAFGMTTLEHKNAVYAYYFYRLLQRAEDVTLLYNTSSDGLNRGEESRFMLQLRVESPHPVGTEYLEAGQSPAAYPPIEIPKTAEVIQQLQLRYEDDGVKPGVLSPSALNAYMDCSLRFYYRYVGRLDAPEEVKPEIDAAGFGTLFHRAAQLAYLDLTAHTATVRKEDLEALLRAEERLKGYVDRAFKEEFFKIDLNEKAEYNGMQLITARVIVSYLKQLLRNDLAYAPFDMVAMEKRVYEVVTVNIAVQPVKLRLGGIIDRMDSKEGTLRIVDYKTGGSEQTLSSMDELFANDGKRKGYIFQTFLYAAIICRQQESEAHQQQVAPALLYIHQASQEDHSPVIKMGEPRKEKLPITHFALLEDEFRDRLQELLAEIFDPNEPFTQTEDLKKCEYCDFKSVCKR